MADAEPLGPADITTCLSQVVAPQATGLVLAVSGGPDSMAMLHLVAGLRGHQALPPLSVATVDHGLRPTSGLEADRVEAASERLGLPFRRLVWSGEKPRQAIQEKARAARYALLGAHCAMVGADHLVTAHTLDDQAETVLFRLLRGSGLSGLAGMTGVVRLGTVRLARPFLGIPKSRLLATCRSLDVTYGEDPANADPRFARTRMRRILPVLAAEGLDSCALARLAGRVARADAALEAAADKAYGDCLSRPGAGLRHIVGPRFAALPVELAIRVLGRALVEAGGRAARLDRLERLVDRLGAAARSGSACHATLGGMVVTLSPDGRLAIAPEPPRRRGRSPHPVFAQALAEGFSWQA